MRHPLTHSLTRSGQHPPRHFVAVTRGVHLAPGFSEAEVPGLAAWAAVLPDRARFTHLSGARLLDLWLPPVPRGLPVTVQVPSGATAPQRPDLRVIRADQCSGGHRAHGLRVAPVEEVLLSLARDLGPLDCLMALDSALQKRLTTEDRVRSACRPRRRGAPLLRALVELSDVRSESPWETVLREFHRCVGATVTSQFEVTDPAGGFVARGDLRLDGLPVLHEYDGSRHLEVARQRHDLRRGRALVAAGWTRRGYTSHDLLHDPAGILRDVGSSLVREHDPSRLIAWRDLLSDSCLTPRGSSRLATRLRPTSRPPPLSS
jgi:hypothetical protein